MSATRRSGSGQTRRDNTSPKRRLCIAKTQSRSKTVAMGSMRGNHNMPPKCNMMIIMLFYMSNRKDRDRMADKSSMGSKLVECTRTLAKELMALHNRRIQGDIKARRRRNMEGEGIPLRGFSNIKSWYRYHQTRARVTWAMRMTWMKALLWPKESRWRKGATRKDNRRDSLLEDIRNIKRLLSHNPGREHAPSSPCTTLTSKLATKLPPIRKSRERQTIHHHNSKTNITKHQSGTRSGKRSRGRST